MSLASESVFDVAWLKPNNLEEYFDINYKWYAVNDTIYNSLKMEKCENNHTIGYYELLRQFEMGLNTSELNCFSVLNKRLTTLGKIFPDYQSPMFEHFFHGLSAAKSRIDFDFSITA